MPKNKKGSSNVFILFVFVLAITFGTVFYAKKQYQAKNPVPKPESVYTLDEVAKHPTGDNCWMAIDGNVYDVSAFTDKHPKGTKYLTGCGKETSVLYNKIKKHAGVAELLSTFKIGKLAN
ncbi:MAG: cytochrome b5-like heme/steroid binding domain-containing protein [Microgenomates group bacterium]